MQQNEHEKLHQNHWFFDCNKMSALKFIWKITWCCCINAVLAVAVFFNSRRVSFFFLFFFFFIKITEMTKRFPPEREVKRTKAKKSNMQKRHRKQRSKTNTKKVWQVDKGMDWQQQQQKITEKRRQESSCEDAGN